MNFFSICVLGCSLLYCHVFFLLEKTDILAVSCLMISSNYVTFTYGVLGHVRYWIELIPEFLICVFGKQFRLSRLTVF